MRRADSREADGELNARVEPATAARVLLGVIEGIRVVAKTGIDRAPWQASLDALLTASPGRSTSWTKPRHPCLIYRQLV